MHIDCWVTSRGSTRYSSYSTLRATDPVPADSLTMNAIGTQTCEMINSVPTRWRLAEQIDTVANSGRREKPVSKHQIDD